MEPHPVAAYRNLLFSLAYRMLGSVQDAEDMVQVTFLRWTNADQEAVRSPNDYLCTTITRLCIDYLHSARVRRERYVGTWLPEPLLTEPFSDLSDSVLQQESLSTAFLVLLESLSPLERVVFLLRDVFDYEYADIARMVDKSQAACRQTARRARQRIAEKRTRFVAEPEQVEALTRRFIAACDMGDIGSLMTLLADDVSLWPDSGGKVRAARNPLHGAHVVMPWVIGVRRKFKTLTWRQANINGQPGLLCYAGPTLMGVMTVDVREDRIQNIYWVANPDKLRAIERRDPA